MSQLKTASVISYLTIITNIVVGIGLTPLILSSLGQSEYGVYMLVGSLIGYLALFDFGLNNTTIRFVSKYRHEKNKDKEEAFIATNLGIYICIAFIIVLVGLMGYTAIDHFFLEKFTVHELYSFKVMYIFMLLNMIWLIIRGAFSGIIMAYEHFIFPKALNFVRILVRVIAIIILLKSGGKAIGIVLIDTAFNLIILITYFGYIHFKLPVKFKFSKFNKKFINKIFSYSIWIFLGAVMDQLYWRSGHTILGIKSTTAEIAVYAISILFVSYYMTLSSAISGLFLPRATKMYVNKATNSELTELMIKVGRIQWFVISYMLFGFIFFGRQFIKLWIGDGYEDSWVIAVIIMIPLTIPSVQNVGNSILEAYNLHARKIQVNTFFAVISVIVAIYLVELYDAIGIAIASSSSIILGQIIYNNFYFKKRLGLNMQAYLKSMLKGNIFSVLILIIIAYLLNFITWNNTSWLNLGLKIFLFITSYTILNYLLAMNSYEKNIVKTLILKVTGFLNAINK
ncbi:MAG: oligosaccharide flippase family protein [Flavobacteriaceae bacterium]